MPNPATIADVEQRWRPLTSAEEFAKVEALLADAWTLLKAKVPLIEERLADETLDAALVVFVVCAMVIRVMRNPDGYRRESIEDYLYERDAASASGSLMVTDDELALLGTTDEGLNGAFTIRPTYLPGSLEATDESWA
jgi:hypothetical protein